MRNRGMRNEEIAQELKVKDHVVEHAARKLAEKGAIFKRR